MGLFSNVEQVPSRSPPARVVRSFFTESDSKRNKHRRTRSAESSSDAGSLHQKTATATATTRTTTTVAATATAPVVSSLPSVTLLDSGSATENSSQSNEDFSTMQENTGVVTEAPIIQSKKEGNNSKSKKSKSTTTKHTGRGRSSSRSRGSSIEKLFKCDHSKSSHKTVKEEDDSGSVLSHLSLSFKGAKQQQEAKNKHKKKNKSTRSSSNSRSRRLHRRTRSLSRLGLRSHEKVDTNANATVPSSPSRPTRRLTFGGRQISFQRRGSGHSFSGSNSDLSHGRSPGKPKKQVRFLMMKRGNDGTTRLQVTEYELPELSPRDLKNTYWSRKEITHMIQRAKNMAENIAYRNKGDTRVVTCLHYCYQFEDPDPLKSKKTVTASKNGLNNTTAYSGLTSPQSALHYYFHYPVVDEDDGKVTTLRGLERQLSFAIVDFQMQCVQAVLTAQSQIRDAIEQDGEEWTPRQVESTLAKHAAQASLPSRRFARLLAKGDAATVGNKNASKGAGGGNSSGGGSDRGDFIESF